MKTPILTASYVARSVNAAADRCINLYPEAVPQGGKEPAFLSRCPGLTLKVTCGDGPILGLYQMGNYGYVVSGSEFYRIDITWTATKIGDIDSGNYPVSMADNGTQIFIATNPGGWIYDTTTGILVQISDADFPGAQTVGYINGYFVFNEPGTQKFWQTALLDGTNVDSLDFASAEGAPDLLKALIVDHLEVWLFGQNSVEIWYGVEGGEFSFQRIQGAFMETGCAASYSIAKLDNSLFWLGSDSRGNGIVYRANGYTAVRASTHAIEYAIQNYSRIDDAIGFSYQQEGHAFYVLSFPSGNATWVFDASTNLWHERAYWKDGAFERHLATSQMNFNNKVVVGDRRNGRVYTFDLFNYTDNNEIQKWLKSWRALYTGKNNLNRTAQHSLQIDCETGVGLNDGQGSDPQVMLRWSDDGGHTWSHEHWRSMGRIGEYGYRTIWRRLGMTEKLRDRVYEISGTDPVKIAIMGAELNISRTNA